MVAAADPAPVGPPTSVGTGGAAATVERLATAGCDRRAAPRRQRGRRRGHGRGGARRDRAVLLRDRRRWLHADPGERREEADHDRPPRDGAGGDEAGLLLGERRAASVQHRALQRPLGRRPRHRGGVGAGAQEARHDLARRSARTGDRDRAQRLRRRPDLRRPDPGESGLLQRHPGDGRALPRCGRHAARRRLGLQEPGPRPHL